MLAEITGSRTRYRRAPERSICHHGIHPLPAGEVEEMLEVGVEITPECHGGVCFMEWPYIMWEMVR
jgi:hypothetical protein